MTARRTRLGLLPATIAMLLAVPASAAAAPYVPPGNSAATQYTEAVPTAGGPKATGDSKHGKGRTPSKVLGSHNAKRLDNQGPEGRAAAEVAAETAPAQLDAGGEPVPGATQGNGSGSGQATGGGGASSSGRQNAGGASNGGGATLGTAQASSPQAQSSSGASGLGEVVGQATGASSSNPLGLLLPLLIVAALVWSVAYFLRQRRRPTG